jgi:hypothetical protein
MIGEPCNFDNCMKYCYCLLALSLFLAVLSVPLCDGQSIDRTAQSIGADKQAKELFESGDYDKAVPILEGAIATAPDDETNAQMLAMAYLYSSSRVDMSANFPKAQTAMTNLIERGWEAVFLVSRANDPMKNANIHVVNAIPGELRIRKGSLRFVPGRGTVGAVAQVDGSSIKECGLNRSYGRDSNSFHLKVLKDNITFRPKHFSKDEADLVCSLIGKYLNVQIVNYK